MKYLKHNKIILVVFFTILVSAIVFSLFICCKNNTVAAADPVPHIGDDGPSGSCSIGDTWMVGGESYFNVGFYDADLNKHTAETTWVCDDHTAAAPSQVGASFTSTVSEVNLQGSYVVYNVYITPPGATDGHSRDPYGRLYGYQHVRGYLRVDKNFVGDISINKISENEGITNNNSQYSYAGAEYGVYTDYSCTDEKATITVDANGYGEAKSLLVGTYYIKEKKASEGYLINVNPQEIVVVADTMTNYKVYEPFRRDPNFMLLHKRDLETQKEQTFGDATFYNAQYAFDYYDGQYNTYEQIQATGKTSKRSWLLRTDESGRVGPILGDAYKIGGDEFYKHNNQIVMPLGTYLVYERATPQGYLLSDKKYIIRVIKNDSAPYGASSIAYDADTGKEIKSDYDSTYRVPYITDDEQIIRGSIEIEKRDIESRLLTCLGAGSFENIEFNISNASVKSVMVDNIEYKPGDLISTLKIHGSQASLHEKALPYGTYIIQEVKTSDSYLLTDGTPRTFQIREDGQVVSFTHDKSFFNQVKRGDYKFVKVQTPDMKTLPNVPFKITSLTTGEWHVLVTDENGQASTENSWNSHTVKTNINDSALTVSGDIPKEGIDESKLDNKAGIWFGLTTEKNIVNTQDSLCALPYDKYILEELPVKVNDGKHLINRQFTISRHGTCVDGGTVDDDPIQISTTATDSSSGTKELDYDSSVLIKDKIAYSGLSVGEQYTFIGELHDKNTGEVISEKIRKEITVSTISGFVELEFRFDTSNYENKELVVFENCFSKEGLLVASHEDINDDFQTVHVKEKPVVSPPEETPIKTEEPKEKLARTGDLSMGLLILFVCIVLITSRAITLYSKK